MTLPSACENVANTQHANCTAVACVHVLSFRSLLNNVCELLADLAKSYGRPFDPKKPLDDWAKKEEEQFFKHRDKNGDKRMDRAEVGEWIMPTDYDPIDAECKHLIYHADTDKVGSNTASTLPVCVVH